MAGPDDESSLQQLVHACTDTLHQITTDSDDFETREWAANQRAQLNIWSDMLGISANARHSSPQGLRGNESLHRLLSQLLGIVNIGLQSYLYDVVNSFPILSGLPESRAERLYETDEIEQQASASTRPDVSVRLSPGSRQSLIKQDISRLLRMATIFQNATRVTLSPAAEAAVNRMDTSTLDSQAHPSLISPVVIRDLVIDNSESDTARDRRNEDQDSFANAALKEDVDETATNAALSTRTSSPEPSPPEMPSALESQDSAQSGSSNLLTSIQAIQDLSASRIDATSTTPIGFPSPYPDNTDRKHRQSSLDPDFNTKLGFGQPESYTIDKASSASRISKTSETETSDLERAATQHKEDYRTGSGVGLLEEGEGNSVEKPETPISLDQDPTPRPPKQSKEYSPIRGDQPGRPPNKRHDWIWSNYDRAWYYKDRHGRRQYEESAVASSSSPQSNRDSIQVGSPGSATTSPSSPSKQALSTLSGGGIDNLTSGIDTMSLGGSSRATDTASIFRPQTEDFWKLGRVFAIDAESVRSNNALRSHDTVVTQIELTASYGGTVYRGGFLRFIVIQPEDPSDKDYCWVLPVTTYGAQGVKKTGIAKHQHGVVYTGKKPPTDKELRSEEPARQEDGMVAIPLKINTYFRDDKLDRMSRVRYALPTKMKKNTPVYPFGTVDKDSLPWLVAQFQAVRRQSERVEQDDDDNVNDNTGSVRTQRVSTAYAQSAFNLLAQYQSLRARDPQPSRDAVVDYMATSFRAEQQSVTQEQAVDEINKRLQWARDHERDQRR